MNSMNKIMFTLYLFKIADLKPFNDLSTVYIVTKLIVYIQCSKN